MATYWNPSDKGSALILSNGNLSARCPSGSVTSSSVRANITKTTGKWYFEIINLDGLSTHRLGWSTDYALTASDLNANLPYTIYAGVGWSMGQTLDRWELSNITHGSSAASVNAVVMTAIDLTSGGKVWFGLNGTWFSGDPAAGTTPSDSWAGTNNILPFITVGASALTNPQVTGRFKTEDFSYTPPSGFSALEASITSGIYDHTHYLLLSGNVVWGTDDLRLVIVDDQYVFNVAHTEYSDVSSYIVSGTVEGMIENEITSTLSLDADDTQFPDLSETGYAIVAYKNAVVGALDRPLLFYSMLTNPGSTLSFQGITFKVKWNSYGILILN